jgi:hypothetical protein
MSRQGGRRIAAVAVIAALAPQGAAGSGAPGQLLYERTLMVEAGARCRLFTPEITAALVASTHQARGAALRAGAGRAALAAVEARAADRARTLPCNSPDLAVGAGRVRQAFDGYARIDRMEFPGDANGWKAVRGVNARTTSAWRLVQTVAARPGRMLLGVAADLGSDRLTAVAAWPGAAQASGARLVVRDPGKSPEPYLDPRRADLASKAPPRAASLIFIASGRARATANLAPTGTAFRFPPAAVHALQALDPREAVIVEVIYPARKGERVERAVFEVGDFAAGYAFLESGR